MRDERQWVPVEVIWDREPREAGLPAQGFPWPPAIVPSPTGRPRPTRLTTPPATRRAAVRDDEPAPRRRKGEGKRRDRKRRPHELDGEWEE
jgi:hypothetical protein